MRFKGEQRVFWSLLFLKYTLNPSSGDITLFQSENMNLEKRQLEIYDLMEV